MSVRADGAATFNGPATADSPTDAEDPTTNVGACQDGLCEIGMSLKGVKSGESLPQSPWLLRPMMALPDSA
jgi:hypothetical protein